MKKLLLGILVIAALLANCAPASADGLYYLGNTANDSDTFGFISMVRDPAGNPVVFNPSYTENNFQATATAITRFPINQVTAPDQAVTFSQQGSRYVEANALTDPEPIVTTQVTAATQGGPAGDAKATAQFFQPFLLTTSGTYTYFNLTSITSTYISGPPNGAASGYSKAVYDLGWWDPTTSMFVPGQFAELSYTQPIGNTDVDLGIYQNFTWDFFLDGAPIPGALPTFAAYSQSYAQVVPVPPGLLLLGSGLMRLSSYRRKKSIKK